jgi:hypothetical protein
VPRYAAGIDSLARRNVDVPLSQLLLPSTPDEFAVEFMLIDPLLVIPGFLGLAHTGFSLQKKALFTPFTPTLISAKVFKSRASPDGHGKKSA